MSALHRSAVEPYEPESYGPEPPLWGEVPPPRPAVGGLAPRTAPPLFGRTRGGGRRGVRAGTGTGRPVLSLVAASPASPRGSRPATRPTSAELDDRQEPLDWRPPPRFRDRVLAAVGTPVAVGVVCFAVAVAVAVAIALLQSHAPGDETATAEPLAADPAAGADPARAAGAAADAPGAAATAQPSARLLVHVIGKVRSPGVVELPPGSRVQDAIAAAGGATNRAALSALNLARPVVDGEQIVVAKRGAAVAAPGTSPPAPEGDTILDLNAADAAALEQLPRIGPALAQRIVDWRTAHGRFASVDQLLQVSGIGAKTLDGFRDRIRV